MKRGLAFSFILASFVLGISSVSAQMTKPGDGAKTYLSDTSPIKFDWYWDASWYTRVKWGGDTTSQFITKKTGVDLNFLLPNGDEANRKNLMIASGDIPDFVSMGWWEPQAKQLEDSGLVWSLTELAQKYDPTFFNDVWPSIKAWYTRADGKVYALPNAFQAPEAFKGQDGLNPENPTTNSQYLGFSVRKDIWEAIGKPAMNTPEKFVAALEAAKAKYPTVGGQPLQALGVQEFSERGSLGITDMLARLVNVQKGVNGKYNDVRLDPEMQRWIKALRLANEKKLISVDFFTDKDQQIKDKISQGRYFAVIYPHNDIAGSFNGELYKADPNSIYITVQGPQNSKLEPTKIPVGNVQGWLVTYISKKVKDPARAIKFYHYLNSIEGKTDVFLGDPKVTRETLADGTMRLKPEISALRDTDEEGFSRKYGARDAYFFFIDDGITAKYLPKPAPWILASNQWYSTVKPVDVMAYEVSLDADTPAGIAFNKSSLKWGQVLPKLILAKDQAEYDKLMADFKTYEAPLRKTYEAEWNKAIQDNITKMGSKPDL